MFGAKQIMERREAIRGERRRGACKASGVRPALFGEQRFAARKLWVARLELEQRVLAAQKFQ